MVYQYDILFNIDLSLYVLSGGKERIFWDETIWEMRDKRKDSSYQEDTYYGIPGVKRLSNSAIVAGCFVFIGIGVVLHILAMR